MCAIGERFVCLRTRCSVYRFICCEGVTARWDDHCIIPSLSVYNTKPYPGMFLGCARGWVVGAAGTARVVCRARAGGVGQGATRRQLHGIARSPRPLAHPLALPYCRPQASGRHGGRWRLGPSTAGRAAITTTANDGAVGLELSDELIPVLNGSAFATVPVVPPSDLTTNVSVGIQERAGGAAWQAASAANPRLDRSCRLCPRFSPAPLPPAVHSSTVNREP